MSALARSSSTNRDSDPSAPARMTLKGASRELVAKVQADQITAHAAAFAYNTVFAIPTLIILTITLAALIDQATSIHIADRLRETIQDRAPTDTKELLTSLVDSAVAKVGGGAASLGVLAATLLALWSGSNAIGALINAFNLAYDVKDTRPIVRRKLMTVGLTLLLTIVINTAFVLLVFGQRLGEWIASKAGLGSTFDFAWGIGRWPASVAAIGVLLAVLYYVGPDIEQSFRWISPGSVIATIAWLVATGFFGIYLRVSNPGSAYGVLGSVLVLLFYLYVTGLIFIIGAELNALVGSHFDPRTVQDLATNDTAEPDTRRRAQKRLQQLDC